MRYPTTHRALRHGDSVAVEACDSPGRAAGCTVRRSVLALGPAGQLPHVAAAGARRRGHRPWLASHAASGVVCAASMAGRVSDRLKVLRAATPRRRSHRAGASPQAVATQVCGVRRKAAATAGGQGALVVQWEHEGSAGMTQQVPQSADAVRRGNGVTHVSISIVTHDITCVSGLVQSLLCPCVHVSRDAQRRGPDHDAARLQHIGPDALAQQGGRDADGHHGRER